MEARPPSDPWEELGIPPTFEREAIRRAYAARLKATNPERDPAAFIRLRAAYEVALQLAQWLETGAAIAGSAVVPARREPDEADAILALLRDGQTAAAFARLEQADAAHKLSIAAVSDLEREFLAAADSTTVPPATLFALSRRFEWSSATHHLRSASPGLFARVDRRLDAEHWYAELSRRAGRGRDGAGPERFVARLLLRGPPRRRETLAPADWRLMLGTPLHHLQTELNRLEQHREWVGDRFDPARIRWCRRRTFPGRVTLLYVLVAGAVAPVTALMQAVGLHPVQGRINVVLWAAVAICGGVWLSHRRPSS